VHIPSKDDRAKPKAFFGDGEEFLLGDEFATKDTVDVDTGDLDFVILQENVGQVVDCDFGIVVGCHDCIEGGVSSLRPIALQIVERVDETYGQRVKTRWIQSVEDILSIDKGVEDW